MYNNYYSEKAHKAVNSRKILENMEEGGEEQKRGKGTQRLHFLAFCGKLQPCWLLQTLNNFCYNEKCHHKLPDKNEEKRNSYSSVLFLPGAKGLTHSQNHSLPLSKNMP